MKTGGNAARGRGTRADLHAGNERRYRKAEVSDRAGIFMEH